MTTDDEINLLRLPWESEDQWKLREAFLRKHWDSEVKNRLVCLSQIFINIEFMGCQYKPELMQKVQLMAEGLADERRTERRKIIEQTFVKASDGKGATLKQKRAHERAQEPKNPFAPTTKKPRPDVVEASTAATKNSTVVGKEKTLTLVKAQLSVAPNHLDPLALLNFACGRAKISWQLEMAESNREFRLYVHDVLVVRQTCKDAASARQTGCAAAAERLRAVNLEVRQEMVKDAKRFVLYTAVDRRSGWVGPDQHFFAGVEQRLAIIRELLKKKHGDNAEHTLQEVCQNERIDLHIAETQLGGWKQQLAVEVAGVRVHAQVFQGKECTKAANNRQLVCAKAIELLGKPTHQVVEADDGTFTLVAGDEASDDQLRAALTGGNNK